MNNRSSLAPSTMARRQFIKMTAGAATLGAFGAARAEESEGTRHVWVLSDLHAGRVEGEKDGAEWFRLGCEDMKTAYSKEHIAQLGGTTFINVASMSHAYGTGSSESYLLEFKRGAKEIVAHRRRHDTRSFVPEFKVQVPLRHPLQFGTV